MGILTEDAACDLRGDIVIFTLFVIVIFVYNGVIPSRKERHSYFRIIIVTGVNLGHMKNALFDVY